jgi:hypothetical protein
MKSADLEAMIAAREALKQIDIFLDGYDGARSAWHGLVRLSFGGYFCELGDAVREQLLNAILRQRQDLAKKLRDAGVEVERNDVPCGTATEEVLCESDIKPVCGFCHGRHDDKDICTLGNSGFFPANLRGVTP